MYRVTFYIFLCFLLIPVVSFSQVLLDENFNYPAGDSLGAHGWVTFNGTTNTLVVTSPGLTYSGYVNSGIGNAARVRNNGYDAYKSFPSDSTTSVYCSFMVRIDSSQTGDYFLAYLPDNSTTNYTGRVFVKDTVGGIKFGVSKSTNPIVYGTTLYSYNTTYLLVVKYSFIGGGPQNDEVRLFVIVGAIPGTEPAPTVGPVTQAINDAPNLGRIALRQGSLSSSPTLTIDGIRVFKSWGNLTALVPIGSVAEKFSLLQNYPNPFNPVTIIEFSIPEDAFVVLDVYDILGRKLASSLEEDLRIGSYRYRFDAQGLSSGVYYYTVTANSQSGKKYISTKSMVILK